MELLGLYVFIMMQTVCQTSRGIGIALRRVLCYTCNVTQPLVVEEGPVVRRIKTLGYGSIHLWWSPESGRAD